MAGSKSFDCGLFSLMCINRKNNDTQKRNMINKQRNFYQPNNCRNTHDSVIFLSKSKFESFHSLNFKFSTQWETPIW